MAIKVTVEQTDVDGWFDEKYSFHDKCTDDYKSTIAFSSAIDSYARNMPYKNKFLISLIEDIYEMFDRKNESEKEKELIREAFLKACDLSSFWKSLRLKNKT